MQLVLPIGLNLEVLGGMGNIIYTSVVVVFSYRLNYAVERQKLNPWLESNTDGQYFFAKNPILRLCILSCCGDLNCYHAYLHKAKFCPTEAIMWRTKAEQFFTNCAPAFLRTILCVDEWSKTVLVLSPESIKTLQAYRSTIYV